MQRLALMLGPVLMVGLALSQCTGKSDGGESRSGKTMTTPMQLTSAAFANGGLIPRQHTCDGPDVSPPLAWTGTPSATKSLALIMDDPDAPAGTWMHWLLYNLSADMTGLPEPIPTDPRLPNGTVQGLNDFGRPGYGGPCPPHGQHRYDFRLYAVDTVLDLRGRVTRTEFLAGIKNHVIGEGQLMGVYARR